MVSIVAFQAVDRGSIPRWRKHIFCSILGWSIVWFIHPSVRPLVSDESTFLHILEGSKNFLPPLPDRTGLWQPFIQPCYFLQKLKKFFKKHCQEWDLNPRPHLWTRIPMAMHVALSFYTWVWRLRPLGHPDLMAQVLKRTSHSILEKLWKSAPGEVWTHNLRIAHTLTDYKYGALTYCATGATTIQIDYFYD